MNKLTTQQISEILAQINTGSARVAGDSLYARYEENSRELFEGTVDDEGAALVASFQGGELFADERPGYQIVNSDGAGLSHGETPWIAARNAVRLATSLSESVYVYTGNDSDYRPIEVAPHADPFAIEAQISASASG